MRTTSHYVGSNVLCFAGKPDCGGSKFVARIRKASHFLAPSPSAFMAAYALKELWVIQENANTKWLSTRGAIWMAGAAAALRESQILSGPSPAGQVIHSSLTTAMTTASAKARWEGKSTIEEDIVARWRAEKAAGKTNMTAFADSVADDVIERAKDTRWTPINRAAAVRTIKGWIRGK
jgi:hypothetical protein